MVSLRKLLPRFSLRTLVIFPLLVTSAVALWLHWQPYYCEDRLNYFAESIEARRRWWQPPGSSYGPLPNLGFGAEWRMRRPREWWGVAYLPELWATVFFAALLLWSILRDRRTLRKEQP